MGGQVHGRRDGDLPVTALVEIRSADVRMVQYRPGIRKGINVIGHEDELPFSMINGKIFLELPDSS